jgi:hypothetical protein
VKKKQKICIKSVFGEKDAKIRIKSVFSDKEEVKFHFKGVFNEKRSEKLASNVTSVKKDAKNSHRM